MLEIGRGIVVIAAGYVVMAFLVRLAEIMLGVFLPPTDPADSGLSGLTVALLICAFLAATFGGWLTARMAAARPLLHTSLLCAAILALGVLAMTSESRGGAPAWYPAAGLVVTVLGAFLGGLFRASRVERIT